MKYILRVAILPILFIVLEYKASAQQPAPPKSPVLVSTVLEQEINQSVSFIGSVEPRMKSLVAGEVRGLVEQFSAREGDAVKKGQVLAHINVTSLKIQLKAAKAALMEVKANHEQVKRDMARSAQLFKEELIPLKQLEDDMSRDKALSERLLQLTAEIERLEDLISKSRILAPFDGVITKEHTEVGQWIQEGSPVVEMIDLKNLRIRVDVPERYIGKLKIGEAVPVRFDALPSFRVSGKISSITPEADNAARTFPVDVEVKNRDMTIKSGMTAQVFFSVGEPYTARLIPKDALVIRGDRNFVYIVSGDTVREEEVKLGNSVKGMVEIKGNVKTGERVVIRGNERLRPGQQVKIIGNKKGQR